MTMAYDNAATKHHETVAEIDQSDDMSEAGQSTSQKSGNQLLDTIANYVMLLNITTKGSRHTSLSFHVFYQGVPVKFLV